MVQNRKLIAIGKLTVERLEKNKELEKSSISFAEYVDNYLQTSLDKDEFLREYFDNISTVGITNNVLFLKDFKKDAIIEIKLVKDQLQSNNDNPVYIQYAIGCPEICELK